jgi:spore coat protein U-like protein
MKKIKLIAGLIALSAFNMAYAATASAPMQVTATVDSKCNISSGNIAFGSIQYGGGTINTNSNITVDCSKDTAYSLAINEGLNPSSGLRRLKHATLAEYFNYTLIDGATNLPIDSTQFYTGVGSGLGTLQSVLVKGRINANTNVSTGNYSDTVTVTITY